MAVVAVDLVEGHVQVAEVGEPAEVRQAVVGDTFTGGDVQLHQGGEGRQGLRNRPRDKAISRQADGGQPTQLGEYGGHPDRHLLAAAYSMDRHS